MAKFRIQAGEQAPRFTARSGQNPRFQFDTAAGRVIVLTFLGSAGDATAKELLAAVQKARAVFDDEVVSWFGISADPADEKAGRLQESLPGIRVFWDSDGAVSRLYGMTNAPPDRSVLDSYLRCSVVLDRQLRVAAIIPIDDPPDFHLPKVLKTVATVAEADAAPVPAPVLVIPRIFEPAFCKTLMEYYDTHGGGESGFMQVIDGKTVGVHNHTLKRRKDCVIEDAEVRNQCSKRIKAKLVPEIAKAFQFHATRIERYLVACYDAETGGFFRPHRDNTTPLTAHRRFAVSLVLNAGEFDGGEVRFPEFGQQTYAPPAGGAVVFSCSLLHEATPVTKGKRYVFLPFLYDEAAAKERDDRRPAPAQEEN